ncbi:MAG TPA: hypothetical protein VFE27_02205 [Acidobacteriaceae bacterium]|nr:hypothetical protein [Acidobacteriaceae bacterium]
MSLSFHSAARRILPATIAALLLALLVTQAASSVCTVQCVQHQMASRPAAAMTHCHAMSEPTNGAAAQSCPPTATSYCVIDLLANTQQKTLAQPTIHADARPTRLVPALNNAARTPLFPLLRSSIGDPPMITPLRV